MFYDGTAIIGTNFAWCASLDGARVGVLPRPSTKCRTLSYRIFTNFEAPAMTASATKGIGARPLRVLAPALAAGLLLASLDASATLYHTTVTLKNADNTNVPATRAVFDWETIATGPTIDSADLSNLKLTLYDGATNFFTDDMIVGGVVQAIGGASRTISDIVWDFDLSTFLVSAFDNDNGEQQDGGASGITYNFYYLPATIYGALAHSDKYNNGVLVEPITSYELTQRTVPIAPTALMLLAGLPLLRARRRAG
jgi:hypothetical protein